MEVNRDPVLRSNVLLKRTAATLPVAALALVGCTSSHKAPAAEKTSSPTSSPASKATPRQPGMPVAKELFADMSWFLQNSTTCQNGGARPCGVRLRSFPEAVDNNVVNQAAPTDHVSYPLEAYWGQAATPLEGVCEVE